ncbi:hypothetical protein DH2020_001448 [Rehmannia glutinosa]|uniref:Fungal lipase-type domain-containing protein n=1 Tax=Rehmannia glutinosa TaxID=99300 RepID=A0ABR0XZG6_REHGL
MAQACYDAFDFDPYSKYCGSCRFTRRDFFDRLGLAETGYEITRYLYATSNIHLPNFFKKSRWPKVWSKNANWIGYIAVSNDETSSKLGRRDICIAWRGTVTRLEWVADLMDFLRSISSDKIPCPDPTVRVESGFLDLYTDRDDTCRYCKFSAREQVLTEVNMLVNEAYPDEEVSITIVGHSLGGALALLSAYDITETGINVRDDSRAVPVCVFTFAGPRMVHPMLIKMAENFPWSYSHVGVELALDHKKSPFLRHDGDLVCAHNLEAHLHLLDGYHGKGQRFVLANGRDYALVNKGCDFLKDEFEIPPNWRQDYNKGMVRNKEGRWVQQERVIILFFAQFLLELSPYTDPIVVRWSSLCCPPQDKEVSATDIVYGLKPISCYEQPHAQKVLDKMPKRENGKKNAASWVSLFPNNRGADVGLKLSYKPVDEDVIRISEEV